jgi:TPR repeat protein
MLALAQAYEDGSLVVHDLDEARSWYIKLASSDIPYDEVRQAKWRLSKSYYSGSLGVRSYPEAARYLLAAAKDGLQPAVDTLKGPTLKGLDREMRKALQVSLQRAGVYDGPVDGSVGPGTLKAIDAYIADDESDAE